MTPDLSEILSTLTTVIMATADQVARLAEEIDVLRVRVEGFPDAIAVDLVEAVGEVVAAGLPTETLTDAVDEALRSAVRTLDGHATARVAAALVPDGMCSPECRKVRKRGGGP